MKAHVTCRLAALALIASGWFCQPAVAQKASNTPPDSATMPVVVEPSKEEKQQQTGLMSGEQPFFLKTDESGEMNIGFDPETNQVEKVTATKGVVFSSKDMTLNSDQLDYNNPKAELIATGRRVLVRQGDIVASCQLFRYNATTQRSELSGNPIIYNKTSDGKVATIAGERFLLYRVDGKPQFKILGGTRAPILSMARSAPAPKESVSVQPAPDQGRARIGVAPAPAAAGEGTMMTGESKPVARPGTTTGTQEGQTTGPTSALGLPGDILKTGI